MLLAWHTERPHADLLAAGIRCTGNLALSSGAPVSAEPVTLARNARTIGSWAFCSSSPCSPAPAPRSARACCPCCPRCCRPGRPAGGAGRSGSCSAWPSRSRSPSRCSRRSSAAWDLATRVLRDLAIVVLLVFGVTLAVPSLAARIEAPLSRIARFGPKDGGDGFTSGRGGRRRAGIRLHAVRGPDPGGRHLGRRDDRHDAADASSWHSPTRSDPRSSCSSSWPAAGGCCRAR